MQAACGRAVLPVWGGSAGRGRLEGAVPRPCSLIRLKALGQGPVPGGSAGLLFRDLGHGTLNSRPAIAARAARGAFGRRRGGASGLRPAGVAVPSGSPCESVRQARPPAAGRQHPGVSRVGRGGAGRPVVGAAGMPRRLSGVGGYGSRRRAGYGPRAVQGMPAVARRPGHGGHGGHDCRGEAWPAGRLWTERRRTAVTAGAVTAEVLPHTDFGWAGRS